MLDLFQDVVLGDELAVFDHEQSRVAQLSADEVKHLRFALQVRRHGLEALDKRHVVVLCKAGLRDLHLESVAQDQQVL